MLINDEIAHDTVMKSSDVGAGDAWVANASPKSLVCWKSGKKPWKSGLKWRPTLWEKMCRQKLHKKLFGQVWGNSDKILRTPKICLLLHLWWKSPSAPIATLLKEQRGKCPRHASNLRRVCAYYSTCTLYSL